MPNTELRIPNPILETEGYEIIELPLLNGGASVFDGLKKVLLGPSSTIKEFGQFLISDPKISDVIVLTVTDDTSRQFLEDVFINKEGFSQIQSQFKGHFVAARIKSPQNSQSET